MANFKEIKNELKKFGLSENQALIYLLVVIHTQLRIQKIVNLTQIPRSSVYENLKILFELGLIEKVVEDKFIRIKPYPISSIRHDLNEKLLQVQAQIANLDNVDIHG